MSTLSLHIDPRRAALLEGQPNDCLVLVRIAAPQAPALAAKRKALNLALVIDRSGSMQGKPLHEAKRCAAMIVDRLGPEDRVAIVVYDSEVDPIVTSRPVIDRAVFHRALETLRERGTTALFDGWLAGAEQAAIAADTDLLSRVLLLSDGCANQGLTDAGEIASRCRQMAATGVSTSTFGLGHHFNEELMVAMASSGQGRSHYGESAEDLLDPFTEEFELMRALCTGKLRLRLDAAHGVQRRVLNDYRQDEHGAWMLPDLAFGAEVWALVSLQVPAQLCGAGARGESLLNVTLSGVDLATGQPIECTGSLTLRALPAAAFAAIAEDARVAARAQELRAAELQLEARRAAQQGDWELVERILRKAEQEAADNPWVAEGIKALRRYAEAREQQLFAKEAMYKSQRMNTRLSSALEVDACYAPDAEAAMPSFLRRKREQGKRMEKGGEKT